MSELFQRQMRVEVGVPGEEGRAWSALRLTCAAKKTSRSAPNAAEITLTNLNADSRGWLEKKGLAVQVFAGYGREAPPLLFAGQVDKVTHELSGTDWTTTLQARDGAAALRALTGASAWRGPLTSTEVLRRVASAMNLKLPALPAGLQTITYPSGYIPAPRGRETLDALAEEVGFEWSIQSGALLLALRGDAATPQVRLIETGTGLIGSPEKTKRGVTFSVQLDARLTPGDLVQLRSRVISGLFVVRAVEHTADNAEGDFKTTVEATAR